jgi:DNA-binding response OmpR family regulator
MAGGLIVNERILIADDDDLVRNGLAAILSTAGYITLVAADGVGVVDEARKYRPHLVMLDSRLPAGNIRKLVRALRSFPELTQVPVIVFASKDYRMSANEVLDSGANVFLTKPFNRQMLFTVIARLLAPDKSFRSLNPIPSPNWRPDHSAPRFNLN